MPDTVLDCFDTQKGAWLYQKTSQIFGWMEEMMAARKTLKILFVGIPHIGFLIREELHEHAGYHVKTETSPEQARVRLSDKNNDFDLLLTGNRIREENDAGMDLVRWTKENCPEIKVILMSVFSENEGGAILAGADAFWHTSCDLSGLLQLIEELFGDSPGIVTR